MKIKVLIEEVITQQFEVEVSDIEHAYNEVRDMYRNGILIVENPYLVGTSMAIHEDDGNISDWMTF